MPGDLRRDAAGLVAGEEVRRWARRLAVPSLCVVPDVGSWSAPCVMAALARVVHNRQGAADPEHNRRENNQQGGLHGDLATAGPPNLPRRSNYRGSNEPTVNAPTTPCALPPQYLGLAAERASTSAASMSAPLTV